MALGQDDTDEVRDRADVEARVDEAMRAAERTRRSARINALVTLGAALLGWACLHPDLQLGSAGLPGALAVGLGWALFELSCATYHLAGPGARLTRVAAGLDELGQPATIYALIYLSGGFTPLLLLLAVLQPFAWLPEPQARSRRAAILRSAACLVLSAAFFLEAKIAEGAVALPVLLTGFVLHGPTARTLMQELRSRAEREVLEETRRRRVIALEARRIARELHDGIGADVMALVLRHRDGDEASRVISERAQQILHDLRAVVSRLRAEESG